MVIIQQRNRDMYYNTYLPTDLQEFPPKDPYVAALGVDAPSHTFPV